MYNYKEEEAGIDYWMTFLNGKGSIFAALEHEISHGDMDAMAAIRNRKRTL